VRNHEQVAANGDVQDPEDILELRVQLETVRCRLEVMLSWRMNGPLEPTEEAMYWSLCNGEHDLLHRLGVYDLARFEQVPERSGRRSQAGLSFAGVGGIY
jgi:hypothetical protein